MHSYYYPDKKSHALSRPECMYSYYYPKEARLGQSIQLLFHTPRSANVGGCMTVGRWMAALFG